MPLEQPIQEKIYEYVQAYLPQDEWYSSYFDFVTDAELCERLAEEFKEASSVYKLFRGIDATDWWLRAHRSAWPRPFPWCKTGGPNALMQRGHRVE